MLRPRAHYFSLQARFEDREFVVTFPFDLNMGEHDVRVVLEAEFKLLCMCDKLKEEFDRHATNMKHRTIPCEQYTFSNLH